MDRFQSIPNCLLGVMTNNYSYKWRNGKRIKIMHSSFKQVRVVYSSCERVVKSSIRQVTPPKKCDDYGHEGVRLWGFGDIDKSIVKQYKNVLNCSQSTQKSCKTTSTENPYKNSTLFLVLFDVRVYRQQIAVTRSSFCANPRALKTHIKTVPCCRVCSETTSVDSNKRRTVFAQHTYVRLLLSTDVVSEQTLQQGTVFIWVFSARGFAQKPLRVTANCCPPMQFLCKPYSRVLF